MDREPGSTARSDSRSRRSLDCQRQKLKAGLHQSGWKGLWRECRIGISIISIGRKEASIRTRRIRQAVKPPPAESRRRRLRRAQRSRDPESRLRRPVRQLAPSPFSGCPSLPVLSSARIHNLCILPPGLSSLSFSPTHSLPFIREDVLATERAARAGT